MAVLIILSRWVHMVAAGLALGGLFFMRFVLPCGLGDLGPEVRQAALLKTRRSFKMVVHSSILLLLLSGAFNAMAAMDKYKLNPPLLHSLLGVHILLALAAFAIAIYVLAGPQPPASSRKLMAVGLIVVMTAIAAASSLKWARERAMTKHANASEPSVASNPGIP